MKNSRFSPEKSDATHVAGWLFADLLIFFWVISLSSQTIFSPGTSVGGENGAQKTSLSSPIIFTKVYPRYDLLKITSDLDLFMSLNNISANSQPFSAEFDGYAAGAPNNDIGRIQALQFGFLLTKARPKLFEGTPTSIGTIQSLRAGEVRVVIGFLPNR